MILEYGTLRSNGNVASEWDVNCSLPGDPEKRLGIYDDQFWIYIGVYVGLVLIAGDSMVSRPQCGLDLIVDLM